jgi:signal transduction histidine kinase
MNPVDRELIEILSEHTFLSSVPSEQLVWLAENGERAWVQKGEQIITENLPMAGIFIVLDGEFEIIRRSSESETVLTLRQRGQILGETGLFADVAPTASVRAACPSQVLKISRETFTHFLLTNPAIAVELMRTSMLRLRNTEVMLNQREKMASLGTLAAGLAHELNNPAAAARRSTSQLRQTLGEWLKARSALDALMLEPHLDQWVIERLRQDIGFQQYPLVNSHPLERSKREEEIENWLAGQGLEEGWELAPTLVDYGWNPNDLKEWCIEFSREQVPIILRWLVIGYNVYNLLDEINHSTERISAIVATVKSYTYLDEAPKKEVDIHDGLENTLLLLKHQLAQGVTIHRDYDMTLPRLEVYASELNQVWTNLIQNAVDAMQGHGTLRLRTYQENDQVVIEIGDDGPGIPGNLIFNLFDPFFTTKGPGKGTGLGLYVSYGIIQKHRGKITVESQPGDTRFTVQLPKP